VTLAGEGHEIFEMAQDHVRFDSRYLAVPISSRRRAKCSRRPP
jgi:hypothetical protein